MDGIALANSKYPLLVGQNLIGLKDAEGNLFVKNYIEAANKTGRIKTEYKWYTRTNKTIEVMSLIGEVVECGGKKIVFSITYRGKL